MGRIKDRHIAQAMEAMGSMAGAAGEQQAKSAEVLRKDFEAIIDNQNEHTLALASLYQAVEALAKAQKVSLPKPLIDMGVEKA